MTYKERLKVPKSVYKNRIVYFLSSGGEVLGFKLACMLAQLFQSCPTLWDLMDCSPPGSSVHGILQAVLELVANYLLQGIFRTQGSNLCLLPLLHRQEDSLPLSHLRSPIFPGLQNYPEWRVDLWGGSRSSWQLLTFVRPTTVPRASQLLSFLLSFSPAFLSWTFSAYHKILWRSEIRNSFCIKPVLITGKTEKSISFFMRRKYV